MRGLLGLALAALLATAGGSARADSAAEWFPLEPGGRGRFDVHRDQLTRPAEGSPIRMIWIGRAEESGDRREGRLRVRTVTRESVVEQNGVATSLPALRSDDVDEYWIAGGDLLVQRRERVASGRTELIDSPPIRVLAGSLAPGSRWSVGTLRTGDLEIPLDARVVGLEALSLSGGRQLEGCLRVAYRGAIRPAGGGGKAGGRWERDAWYARGVGLVQEVTRIEVEREEEGRPVSFSETVRRTRRLPAPSPEPAP